MRKLSSLLIRTLHKRNRQFSMNVNVTMVHVTAVTRKSDVITCKSVELVLSCSFSFDRSRHNPRKVNSKLKVQRIHQWLLTMNCFIKGLTMQNFTESRRNSVLLCMHELQSILLKILGKILSGCEYIIFNGVFLDIYFEIPSYILVTGNILVITDNLCSAISMNPRITVTVLCQLPSDIQIMGV